MDPNLHEELFGGTPERLRPYVTFPELSAPISLAEGPFELVGRTDTVLDGQLSFKWLPAGRVEFQGVTTPAFHTELDKDEVTLISRSAEPFEASVTMTHISSVSPGNDTSVVRGITRSSFDVGSGRCESVTFSLFNFPEYFGDNLRSELKGTTSLSRGRLSFASDAFGECVVDTIAEAKDLVLLSRGEGGFVISHVGRFQSNPKRTLTRPETVEILQLLHFWFGFLRAAWAGPILAQGMADDRVVWREIAHWKADESQAVPTWLPQLRPLMLSEAFTGFVNRWKDPAWNDPLRTAISWLVEANSSRVSHETRIILGQVALELLGWVHLVDTQRLHSHRDFNGLSAAGKMRLLLQHVGVPTTIPGHLVALPSRCRDDVFDGPGVIADIRNALVHSTSQKRTALDTVTGEQMYECSQLALQYVELVLLSVCGYRGAYARRGWRGWRGQNEGPVPWAPKS
jgi:hypothetical protein